VVESVVRVTAQSNTFLAKGPHRPRRRCRTCRCSHGSHPGV